MRRLANLVVGRWGAVCWLCGEPIDLAASRRSSLGLTVDHVVPRSKGGGDDVSNRLIPARAGKTHLRQRMVLTLWAHPRACGENGLFAFEGVEVV